ncbi:hypothetical protein HMF7854_00365 [Sphingomonas ginkgonis]|uniref:Uncharacterized protein n=1 Tax=Sphingomonas ginkgonis TaxID=2315330 RepID=A0A3R9Y3M8_9SPHN|nr:hypothetical protein [Sphingomonas ginkgonis]RST29453.1 hypothetical protein HMF7854_00365 [Sphingomonas ginkgonis]
MSRPRRPRRGAGRSAAARATVAALLTLGAEPPPNRATLDCRAARVAWSRAAGARLRELDQACAAAWERLLADIPPDDEAALAAVPEPPEQALLDAHHAAIQAILDHDRWPREAHAHAV